LHAICVLYNINDYVMILPPTLKYLSLALRMKLTHAWFLHILSTCFLKTCPEFNQGFNGMHGQTFLTKHAEHFVL